MKPADVKAGILTKVLSIMTNIRNLKLVIMREYQIQNIVFAKGYTPSWSEQVFVMKKIKQKKKTKKKHYHGHMLLVILMVKKLLEHSMKKSCPKQGKRI